MKIIVYDDNPDFGGHQIMACRGIEALAAEGSHEILFMHNPKNRRLAERIADIDHCSGLISPCSTRRLQGIINHLDHRGIRRLQSIFKKLQADLILCIQGDIEDSSQAILAAHRAGLECVSYIALPHDRMTMGAKLGKLRDIINKSLFYKPVRYITISESMGELLRRRGLVKPIDIVPNGIPMHERILARNPQHESFTIGLLGRMEFKQKQQDFMVRTFCDFPEIFKDCTLLIAGDGPDREKLEQLIAESPRCNDITLQPWKHDTEAFFAAIDLLVIPSRFEGMPLVMLEALARGIPVIGSRRDGMKDLLPESWTFETENAEAMAKTFAHVRETWQGRIDAVRERILREHSLEAFNTRFCKAVLGQ